MRKTIIVFGKGEKMDMSYQIYLDSFLIQEWIMNFYVLKLCNMCLMCTATNKRLIWASFFAGIYQVLLLFLPFPQTEILFYIIVFFLSLIGSFITIFIAFQKAKISIQIKRIGMYFSMILVIGGIFIGILPRFSFYKHSQAKVILIVAFGTVIYKTLWLVLKNKRQSLYYGKMALFHKDIKLDGIYFMDSGNGLMESISKKPVLLADEKWLEPILKTDDLFMRPVVYRSVGKSKGIIYAYCVDELVIYDDTFSYKYEKVWVGVCKDKLLENQKCQVILPLFYGISR